MEAATSPPPPTDPAPTDPAPTDPPPGLAMVPPEVREGFRALSGAIGQNTTADREMLELWFDVITSPPTRALQAYSTLTSRYLPWVERRLVRRARQRGSSWSAIGRMLGRSRQAVQQRHDCEISLDELLPPRPQRSARRPRDITSGDIQPSDITSSDIVQARADQARQRDADEAERHGGVVAW